MVYMKYHDMKVLRDENEDNEEIGKLQQKTKSPEC